MENRMIVIMAETRDRLAEQYGLNLSPPVSRDWSGIDIGFSNPVELFMMFCRFIADPLMFMIHYLM